MKKLAYLITVLTIVGFCLLLTSCKTSGYGCHGNQSWKHMVRRINSQ